MVASNFHVEHVCEACIPSFIKESDKIELGVKVWYLDSQDLQHGVIGSIYYLEDVIHHVIVLNGSRKVNLEIESIFFSQKEALVNEIKYQLDQATKLRSELSIIYDKVNSLLGMMGSKNCK